MLAIACAAIAGCGSAESRDERSARSFLVDVHALEATAARDARQEAATAQRFIAGVRANCPGALTGAPANGGPLAREALVALEIARGTPVRPATERFARLVRSLRFTDPGITAEAGEVAQGDAELAALQAPRLCADARAYMQSQGLTEPATTRRLLELSEAAMAKRSVKFVPLANVSSLGALLEHYESSQAWLRRVEANSRIAAKLQGGHNLILTDRNQLLVALGLHGESS